MGDLIQQCLKTVNRMMTWKSTETFSQTRLLRWQLTKRTLKRSSRRLTKQLTKPKKLRIRLRRLRTTCRAAQSAFSFRSSGSIQDWPRLRDRLDFYSNAPPKYKSAARISFI